MFLAFLQLSQETQAHIFIFATGGVVSIAWLAIQLNTALKITQAVNGVSVEISKVLALVQTHLASDEQKHKAIDDHLEATDGRVGRIEDRIFAGR